MNGLANDEVKLQGIALSEGFAVAHVCLFSEHSHYRLPLYRVLDHKVEWELGRLNKAIDVAVARLSKIRSEVEIKIGPAEAEIFVAHQLILEDKSLRKKILDRIVHDRLNAEAAVDNVMDEMETRLQAVDDAYIKERASDFGEIKRRLLVVLADLEPSTECPSGEHCQKGHNRIVVLEELTPALAVEMDTRHVMGFVTERGGVNSHASILARALGVPAVSGLPGIRARATCGTEVLVNGNTGEVVIWPTSKTVAETRKSHPAHMRMLKAVEPVTELRVMANINMAADVGEVLEMKAEGIGLYRTEIEAIAAGKLLTEADLAQLYLSVRRAMGQSKVVYRLFDIGSDKPLPSLQLPSEENPSLGWRGARLLLGQKDLFRAQARALARVSQESSLDVMYPMVVDLEQFRTLKKAFDEATAGMAKGEIRHGLMFEVPSACLEADAIFAEADFGSIGTNDLTQYLFAVDRGNENVSYDYNPDRPVFWSLIQKIAEAARRHGKPLSVCGELAGEPRFLPKLFECGVETVSVSARRIPALRTAILELRKNR